MSGTSFISAVSWIPRGAAAQNPYKYVVDAAELERVGALARVRLEDAQMELELAQATEGAANGEEGADGWEE
jgi:periodic tryptophan protein 1